MLVLPIFSYAMPDLGRKLICSMLKATIPEVQWSCPCGAESCAEDEEYFNRTPVLCGGGKAPVKPDACIIFYPCYPSEKRFPAWIQLLIQRLQKHLPDTRVIWVVDDASAIDKRGVRRTLSKSGTVVNILYGRSWPSDAPTMEKGLTDIIQKGVPVDSFGYLVSEIKRVLHLVPAKTS